MIMTVKIHIRKGFGVSTVEPIEIKKEDYQAQMEPKDYMIEQDNTIEHVTAYKKGNNVIVIDDGGKEYMVNELQFEDMVLKALIAGSKVNLVTAIA
jgi:TPP-dependent 2-oxoacid decarboxylase